MKTVGLWWSARPYPARALNSHITECFAIYDYALAFGLSLILFVAFYSQCLARNDLAQAAYLGEQVIILWVMAPESIKVLSLLQTRLGCIGFGDFAKNSVMRLYETAQNY